MVVMKTHFILLLYCFFISQKIRKTTYTICDANMKPFYFLHWSEKYYLQTSKIFLSSLSLEIHIWK